MNSLDNEFEFMDQTKCQPSEINQMPYWKFEMFIERLNRKNDKEKERQKNQEKERAKEQKTQKIPQQKIPKVNIPKFKR